MELLAEVLINTESLKSVLAIARCSKAFCNTLVDPSSSYIWKNVRGLCHPSPLPDPFPTFTETSFAAFMFDATTCEVRAPS